MHSPAIRIRGFPGRAMLSTSLWVVRAGNLCKISHELKADAKNAAEFMCLHTAF